MNSLFETLRGIGLTESEVKVYLALLDLGPATRGEIVSRSGIAGSKVYEILDRLQKRGLSSTYVQNNIKHFKALNPQQLVLHLEEQKTALSRSEIAVQNILPDLLARFSASKQEQEVELLAGLKGLEVVFTAQIDELKRGDYCYVLGGTRETEQVAVLAFFEKVHLLREQKGIKTRMLFNEEQRERTISRYGSERFPNTEVRFIGSTSPVAINVYGSFVTIIVFGEEITAIRIKSKLVADSFNQHFMLLWNDAKSTVHTSLTK